MRRAKGISLLELAVVVLILAVAATISSPSPAF